LEPFDSFILTEAENRGEYADEIAAEELSCCLKLNILGEL
jgi:hypothetical protein